MADATLYKNSTDKPIDVFLCDLEKQIEAEGFGIYHRDKSDLVGFYRAQGVDQPQNYHHVMLQICKPENSGKVVPFNPERMVFVHKYIFIYNKGDKTEIRVLGYSGDMIAELLGHNEYPQGPSDDEFAKRMEINFEVIDKIVKAAL